MSGTGYVGRGQTCPLVGVAPDAWPEPGVSGARMILGIEVVIGSQNVGVGTGIAYSQGSASAMPAAGSATCAEDGVAEPMGRYTCEAPRCVSVKVLRSAMSMVR